MMHVLSAYGMFSVLLGAYAIHTVLLVRRIHKPRGNRTDVEFERSPHADRVMTDPKEHRSPAIRVHASKK